MRLNARSRGTAILAAIVCSWALAVGCSSGGGDEESAVAAPPSVVECVPATSVPTAGSVTAQCGSINGSVVNVDIVATDIPSTESVIAAVADLRFTPQAGTLAVSLQGCSAGSALGNPADLIVACAVAQSNPAELLVGVSRTGTTGVTISGSQTLITLQFRVTGLGNSPIQFLLQNTINGSALLRPKPAPNQNEQEVIGGLTFSGATISGT